MNSQPAARLEEPWVLEMRLRMAEIRRGARKVLDLLPLEAGSVGRLLAALILSAAFFLTTLALFWLAGTPPLYAIGVGVFALLTAEVTSAVLVLWSSDEELEAETVRLREDIRTAKKLKAERMTAVEAELVSPEEQPETVTAEPVVSEYRPKTHHVALPPSHCPYCDQTVSRHAVKCPHCHEYLDESYRPKQPKNAALAAFLSFWIPGLGQAYRGHILAGFVWFWLVVIGHLFCFFPGIVLRVMCVFDAASGD